MNDDAPNQLDYGKREPWRLPLWAELIVVSVIALIVVPILVGCLIVLIQALTH